MVDFKYRQSRGSNTNQTTVNSTWSFLTQYIPHLNATLFLAQSQSIPLEQSSGVWQSADFNMLQLVIKISYRKFENTSQISVTWGVRIRGVLELKEGNSFSFWDKLTRWIVKIGIISGIPNLLSVNKPFTTKPIISHIISRLGNTMSGQF
jgi:hypothetical protein